jgi:hypothetical protein
MSGRTYLGIGMTIAAVAVGGWKSAIPGLDFAQAAHGGENPIAAAAAFTRAGAALAQYEATAETYSGAELSPTYGVTLVWATDTGYCLQGTSLHLVGPAGVPSPGPCPPG